MASFLRKWEERNLSARLSNIKALVNTIRKGLPNKRHFALGLYGLEDAYYRVHILTLVDKMMNCGVMVRWILSMLDTRGWKISFATGEFDFFEVSSDLSQGCPLASERQQHWSFFLCKRHHYQLCMSLSSGSRHFRSDGKKVHVTFQVTNCERQTARMGRE